ncbi:MAG TPA: hypothetical protein VKM72_22085 [Thermoanaerobaculia bacterium]|nr:hypothetical protein [Thermoanaerobaculia bacterium]
MLALVGAGKPKKAHRLHPCSRCAFAGSASPLALCLLPRLAGADEIRLLETEGEAAEARATP